MNLTDLNFSLKGGQKTNPETISYGNKDGMIQFGRLHMESDNLNSTVTSGVYLGAYDSRHYMTFDIDGHRKGWTLNRCPGSYEILCGTETKEKDIGFFLLSENGDIVIRAPNGRVRISALDVDIRATGPDNSRGTINLDSNQSVNVKTGSFDVNATVGVKIFTPYTMDLISNVAMNLTSNFMNGLTAASKTQNSKTAIPLESTVEFNLKSAYNII
jgi:hypothetical protein